jgi:hypothetical protein
MKDPHEYIEEEADQIIKEVMECNYYPDEVTDADMKDYLEKEKRGEAWYDHIEQQDQDMKKSEAFLVHDIERRMNEHFHQYGITPNEETAREVNEEIAIHRLKLYANEIKEMKAEFQVDKWRILHTFNNQEERNKLTGEQIRDHILGMHVTKKGIEESEKRLREWEQEVRQKYHDDDDDDKANR